MRRKLLIALAVVTPLGFATKLVPAIAHGLDLTWVGYYAGGALYEVFWVLGVLAVRPGLPPRPVALGVLLATCVLEGLQLWSTPLLDAIRGHFLGRTLIGSTFSWWDFPVYGLGCVLALLLVRGIARLDGSESRLRRDGSPGGPELS